MSRLSTDERHTECEERARILETEFAILRFTWNMKHLNGIMTIELIWTKKYAKCGDGIYALIFKFTCAKLECPPILEVTMEKVCQDQRWRIETIAAALCTETLCHTISNKYCHIIMIISILHDVATSYDTISYKYYHITMNI